MVVEEDDNGWTMPFPVEQILRRLEWLTPNPARKQYFFYQCNRIVLITASPAAAAGELSAPTVAEVTIPAPTFIPLPFPFPFASTMIPAASTAPAPAGAPSTSSGESPSLSSSSSSAATSPSRHNDISSILHTFLELHEQPRQGRRGGSVCSAASTATPENEPEPFDPVIFFQNYLHNLMDGGANIQVLLDDARVSLGPSMPRRSSSALPCQAAPRQQTHSLAEPERERERDLLGERSGG
uniref:Uncharacterized protein n=1 Tax=Setaria viridis TaxID=4556 RepID=A0A4U6TM39_SETVI|nr:hypothetical protein SEVIR_7G053700v2 [Setaria viridis]